MYGTAPGVRTTALDTRIPGGPEACGAAREIVARLVSGTTPAGTLHDALLLTSELVTNAVLHGGVDGAGVVDLQVARSASLLRISVTDPGGETSPTVQDLDVTVPGGMGLFLVDQISSRWGVDELADGGTQVWFELIP
jgi:anti-sigma regulatory factor (Ser/Thr protein kinase)